MAIVRPTTTDDDGTGNTGTIHNNTWWQDFFDKIDAGLAAVSQVVQTTTATGTQNDFALTTGVALLRCNNATATTFTGLAAGTDGQQLDVMAIGAGQVNIANQSGSSSAANRVINHVTGTISLVGGTGRCRMRYDATTARWRVLTHAQGGAISPAFSAGDYTASGSMTWTVEAADVGTYAYELVNKVLHVWVYLAATTVAGTPSTQLIVAIPGGFTAGLLINGFLRYVDNGGANTIGFCQTAAGGATILLFKVDSSNWTASPNATQVLASVQIPVS